MFLGTVQAQWYLEDDEGRTIIGGITNKVMFYTENGESTYSNQRSLQLGMGKSIFSAHGHAQRSQMIFLAHQQAKAVYFDGYKSLSMTNLQAQVIGSFSLGHLIFAGIDGGVYVAVPIFFKGETVRQSVPTFSKTYERPYFYQGFLAGGTVGVKLKNLVLATHGRLDIPFIKIFKPQPEEEGAEPLTPQLLTSKGILFSVTFKAKD